MTTLATPSRGSSGSVIPFQPQSATPNPTLTHISLHRCRFVDFPPSEIAALAFSHPSSPASSKAPPKSLRLAIGRENGSIEIWNPLNGFWHHELTMPGGKDRHIGALVWTVEEDASKPDATGLEGLRLFSIGYSTEVTEWDLITGRPKRHVDCHGGALWSIAVQPPQKRKDATSDAEVPEETAQKIVVGTDDGTVKVLSTADGDLTFEKNLMRAGPTKARVLTLAWKDKHTVVAGMADSRLRVWDIRSGRAIAKMSMGRERKRDILVWALKVTKSGDIVTGDSRGEVSFWDGGNYTLKQRVKAHEADCLALEVGGKNGECVMSAGADMRTVLFRIAGRGGRWTEVAHKRLHKHDVRAMAAYESGHISMVVTGGVDMMPIVTPFRNFTTEKHIILSLIPQQSIVATIPDHRVLMSYWEREVKIWRLDELAECNPEVLPDEDSQGRTLLSHIVLKNDEYITTAAITAIPDNAGFLLAVATTGEIKFFHLRNRRKPGAPLRVHKLPLSTIPIEQLNKEPSEDSENSDSDDAEELDITTTGARHLSFSPNGEQLLIVTPDSEAFMFTPSTSRLFAFPLDAAKRPEDSIHLASLSNTHVAFATLAGEIHTFSLATPHPTQLPSPPRLSAPAKILSLRPNSTDLLTIPANSRYIHLLDLATGRLSQWSRDNPNPPNEFKNLFPDDQPIGAFWEPEGNRAWVHGANWVWMFDFSRNWPGHVNSQHAFQTPNPKRRRDGELVEASAPAATTSEVGFPATAAAAKREKGQRPFWGSLRYKGLLAFLPIGKSETVKLAGSAGSGMETEEELDGEGLIRAVEVVVVERPIWDAHKALPPRFFDGRN